jgi:hypothetical protein
VIRFGFLALFTSFAIDASAQALSESLVVRPLADVNSASDDYAPSYDPARQLLLFVSERSGDPLLYASNGYGATFAAPQVEGGEINRNHHPCAFITISANGEAFAARYLMREHRSYVGIVSVGREAKGFACGQPLDIVNGDHFASHPSVSPDGTMLVYASDRSGGFGGLDLWMTRRVPGGTWEEPVNLSDVLNSEGDEVTPFFASNDTLLYSSNGYGGRGGFDIFRAVYKDGRWQEPEPVDALNSEFNDSDCAIVTGLGYVFASDRPGGQGGLDLYWLNEERR